MRMERLAVLAVAVLGLAPMPSPAGSAPRLIAHRGGVVDAQRPENSAGALEEAIRRGYWMVEIDIQETKDGRLVVHHDGDFRKSYGVPRRPGEMTWAEISALRAREDGSRPLELREHLALCRDRMRVMMDTKGSSHPPAFYQEMERALRENGLLAEAFFIGNAESRAWFKGKARISATRKELEEALRAGEDTARLYFLFEHGTTLDEAGLALAARAGAPAVVSINDFHYAGRDHMQAAHADILRLRKLGMIYFQIDAVYDRWLR